MGDGTSFHSICAEGVAVGGKAGGVVYGRSLHGGESFVLDIVRPKLCIDLFESFSVFIEINHVYFVHNGICERHLTSCVE